ncbi:hypothetical protein [Nostoc sp.]|uniref:hypothetical protein n=1 Tax=Nostoc sp. TaxID=1180 RepID=UPI002FF8BBA7
MFNLFRDPAIEPPTLFEQDINNLVERLKAEVRYIYRQYQLLPYVGLWIYGNNGQNQEMLLFKQFADLIVSKYSPNRTQTEPKNLYAVYEYFAEQANNNYSQSNNPVVEVAKWINDTRLVSQRENLDEVISAIESLKVRVANFKERKPL